MAHDLLSKFYTCLNLPLHQKILELSKIIEQFSPNKELEALFPELIDNIFATTFGSGWDLKTVTLESNKYYYETLISFLHPQGPMFRLCYKLLSDPQLKYQLPLSSLPLDVQMTIERGRCPQFYADMLATDPHTMNVTALMLNPFDYYMFNFALHVVNNNQNRISWDSWNSVYFALACDYLLHFLPVDPNEPVLPHIPNYTGKVPMIAPLQTANRPLYSPSLLLIQDLSGSMMNNQPSSQTQSRNEVWRSETVLQVFIDIWMSVEQFNGPNNNMYQRNYPVQFSSSERVRTVRVLIKHLHAFSAKHQSDPAIRSSALRKYARQVVCARAYHYIKHLVTTWPLDASFRLVLELWLSFIQPWRYVNNSIIKDRLSDYHEDQQVTTSPLDPGFTQFIAENFPSYVCIFQLVLPRFARLDLTAYKNTVMLFRLGKVFAQPHLVPILKNLEQAIIDSGTGLQHSPESSLNNSGYDSYAYNGLSLHKWATIAKQALPEFNLSANFEYQPLWSDRTRQLAVEFVQKIQNGVTIAINNSEEFTRKINAQNSGLWSGIKHWLMMVSSEDEMLLEEYKKVAPFLNACVRYFSTIFALSENSILQYEPIIEESLENSSFANSSTFPNFVTNKLRSTATVHYMGDPDLMPITTYESTILVRMLYQIASRINELYQPQFSNLWDKNDFWGFIAREVLQKPCRIKNYVKDVANYQNVVTQEMPARLSLRKLGSQAFVVWFTLGYLLFKMFSYSGFAYVCVVIGMWMTYVLVRASLKILRL